ncbi:MAG: hypothetical protein KC416_15860, partial [Myxococcales bacterium]|nr:hypothetical protein [Myxococcales bacterium]
MRARLAIALLVLPLTILSFACGDDGSSDNPTKDGGPDATVDAMTATDSGPDGGDAGPCLDTDKDSVCDADDQCPGQDDIVDSDSNGTADCEENLIDNGQFPTGVSGWTAETDGEAVHATDDANSSDHSGSIKVTNKDLIAVNPTRIGATFCVKATPLEDYVISAEYMIET